MIQVDYSKDYHLTKTKMKSSLPILAAFLHLILKMIDIKKVLITIVSEAKDQSCVSAFTCVSKVIDCIEKRMPLLSSLQCIFIWSDGCSMQLHSCFTFVLLIYLHPDPPR